MTEAHQVTEWIRALDGTDKQALRSAVDGLIAALRDSPQTASTLKDLLDDPRRKNRWALAYVLAHLPEPAGLLEPLLDALDDPDPDIRWAIILLLARLAQGGAVHLELPLSLLETGTVRQRRMVIYYLKELKPKGETARRALLSALGDCDPTVRVAAVITLKDQDVDPVGREDLLELLVGDRDARVQHAAAITLASLGSPSSEFLSALDHAAQSPQAPLRKAAAAALRLLEEKKEVRPIQQLTLPLKRTSD